jgi:hypothetical protein
MVAEAPISPNPATAAGSCFAIATIPLMSLTARIVFESMSDCKKVRLNRRGYYRPADDCRKIAVRSLTSGQRLGLERFGMFLFSGLLLRGFNLPSQSQKFFSLIKETLGLSLQMPCTNA